MQDSKSKPQPSKNSTDSTGAPTHDRSAPQAPFHFHKGQNRKSPLLTHTLYAISIGFKK